MVPGTTAGHQPSGRVRRQRSPMVTPGSRSAMPAALSQARMRFMRVVSSTSLPALSAGVAIAPASAAESHLHPLPPGPREGVGELGRARGREVAGGRAEGQPKPSSTRSGALTSGPDPSTAAHLLRCSVAPVLTVQAPHGSGPRSVAPRICAILDGQGTGTTLEVQPPEDERRDALQDEGHQRPARRDEARLPSPGGDGQRPARRLVGRDEPEEARLPLCHRGSRRNPA